MIKPLKIILPENSQVKTTLQKKLTEYEHRVARLKKKIRAGNPELSYISIPGFKALITRRLHLRGSVETQELAREIVEEYGRLNPDEFNAAAEVIQDYCQTGGKKLKKTSGF